MTAPEPEGVRLSEEERKALWQAGDHHPDTCDCSAYMPEEGYPSDDSLACNGFLSTLSAVERMLAAREQQVRAETAREVFERAREYLDEIEGAAIPLPGGASLWLHSSDAIDTWLRDRLTYEVEHGLARAEGEAGEGERRG